MSRLIPLGDARARDPRVAGHKAAELARAVAAELPVLPGRVLPLGGSTAALAAASDAASGPAAILVVAGWELGPELRRALADAVLELGGRVVVRSSSPLEDDPRWAGAFATYLDVGADEVEAAVRGCWASAFARDARARGDLLGTDPAAVGIAVLMQPFVAFAGGGVAMIEPDGATRISAAEGPPSELLAGRTSGTSLRVGADTPGHDADDGPRDGATFARVVALARSVHAGLGADAIEWGVATDGGVWLLQLRTAASSSTSSLPSATEVPRRGRRTLPPVADRLASAAASYPGALGERWVLPWALALDDLPVPARVDVHDPESAAAEAASLAASLAASAWEVPTDRVDDEVAASFRGVLGHDPVPELAKLSTIGPPSTADAARLLGLVEGIGIGLHRAGAIASREDVWRLAPEQLLRVICGGRAPVRRRVDRWEPFVFAVARDRGRTVAGRSASPGIAAGRTAAVDLAAETMPPPRRVLVVRQAVPQLAPMLWEAAGLVAAEGSEGAHLFEVARSLGVPAILGVELDPAVDRIAAVDGDLGTVSVLTPGPARRQRPSVPPLERMTG